MLWYVIVIEAIAFAVLFTTILFVSFHGDRMYSAACIHNYPPDIQEEYFKTHDRVDVSYRSKKVILAKSFGILIFTAILFACAKIAGAETFWQGCEDIPYIQTWSQMLKKRLFLSIVWVTGSFIVAGVVVLIGFLDPRPGVH